MTGDGRVRYWFRGPDNVVTRNVGANANVYGMCFMMLFVGNAQVPVAQGSDDARVVNMAAHPWREFRDNEFVQRPQWVHDLGLPGELLHRRLRRARRADSESPVVAYRPTRLLRYASNRLTLDGFTHINKFDYLSNIHETTVSLFFGDYLARNTTIRNADIQGLRVGIAVPYKAGDVRDIYGAQPGTVLIENSVLRNQINVLAQTQFGVTGGGNNLPPRRTTIRNVAFGTIPANVGGGQQQVQIAFQLSPDRPNPNVLVRDEILVEQPAGSYRVFMKEQAPDFVLPAQAGALAGLTNQQAWQQAQQAVGGAVAPCSTTVQEVAGFVCGGFAVSPPIPSGPLTPTPPIPSDPIAAPPGDPTNPAEPSNPDALGRCTVSEWSEWSAWSDWVPWRLAMIRSRTRFRTIINPGTGAFNRCPRLTDTDYEVAWAQAPDGAHHDAPQH